MSKKRPAPASGGGVSDPDNAKRKREGEGNSLEVYPPWFVPNAVSGMEVRSLANLFQDCDDWTGTYLQIRRGIIDLYAENPSSYLTATQCRKKISGEVGAILQVHEFLDTQKVINQHVVAQPNSDTPRPTSRLLEQEYEHEQEAGEASQGIAWDDAIDALLVKHFLAAPGDWSAIAAAVGYNSTPRECFLRFVSLSVTMMSDSTERRDVQLASDFAQEVCEQFSLERSKQIVTEFLEETEKRTDIKDIGDASIFVLSGAAVLTVAIAERVDQEAVSAEESLRASLEEYIKLRMDVLREKVVALTFRALGPCIP